MRALWLCGGATVLWAAAFAAGVRLGSVHLTLGAVAALVCVLGQRDAAVRALLRPTPRALARDLVLGVVLGAASLALTHLLLPPTLTLLPAVRPELVRLYAIAAITPALLLPVCLVIVAEELLWRGVLLRALRAHLPPLAAASLATLSYAAAQLGAGSPLLCACALALGAVWMGLRLWSGGLVLGLVSHAVWTLGVLGFWPLNVAAP